MRVAILGNSVSGKSTLACWLASRAKVPMLDLDTVAWEPGQIAVALEFAPRLVFLNPGEAQCLKNCAARPWESHKYASKQEQDERLSLLLSWVSEYYRREGELSLAGHRRCFVDYAGAKSELNVQPALDPPSADVRSWLS